MTDAYLDIIARKALAFQPRGLDVVPSLNSKLSPLQAHCVDFAARAGCAALFLDTGLGKTFSAEEWGRLIVEKTNKPVLMLAPLAVSGQHHREAEKWGIDARAIREPEEIGGARVYITNYERLAKFGDVDFGGVILDESSILKSFSGATTRALMARFSRTPYRLSCTATPAPNDHMELGQQSQFLGVMDSSDMLSRWFFADQANMGRYRIKRPGVTDFWRWVASWARCVSRPSDLGFSDDGYELPPLETIQHVVTADISVDAGAERDGQARLFRIPDTSATSIHREKRLTVEARAAKVAEIVYGDWSCGSQNTARIEKLKTSPSAASGPAAEVPTKTRPTCANTIKPTATSGSVRQSRPSGGTLDVESAMPKTQSIANGARNSPESAALIESATGASALSSECLPPSSTLCSPPKAVAARYAAPSREVAAESASPSTTATGPVSSEVSSAPIATTASGSSPTMSIGSGEPLNTSNAGREWWVIWCDTDYEQDALERHFGDDAFSIRGSQPPDLKERLHAAWLAGERKALICKPTMFGHGLNWQHCARMAFAGLSFSYEQYYQAVRRCHRFGQKRVVQVHIVGSDTETAIWQVIARKSGDHDSMKAAMTKAMAEAAVQNRGFATYRPAVPAEFPAFLRG